MKNIPHNNKVMDVKPAVKIVKRSCVEGGKHKYIFIRNITITNATYSPRGNQIKISYRGEYKCECGKIRIGAGQ